MHGLLFTVQIKKKVIQMANHSNKCSNVIITMTWLRAGWPRIHGLIPSRGKKFQFSPNVETGSGAQPTLYPMGAKVSFPLTSSKVKAAEARR
jgi:hypothetical protein